MKHEVVDTFTEMMDGDISTRLLCSALMDADDDILAQVDPAGARNELQELVDGNLADIPLDPRGG